ncbi:hypothetical protein JOC75_003604 [Metabacillus crassostreae]|uniref:hypothetical protein n=1 Tax=Metabacillus crassostreae TaxID=929098 RepID=UPI00195DA1E6|nr:hypothetical protein [Metabacillus crassostreae]MBM7605581.1 hypothetical protein [Metabacillus crassostreae]
MDKYLKRIISSALIISLTVPVLINILMYFIHMPLPVAGDKKTWISTLGSFWGAIIGGLISGALTLYGVRATIKSTQDDKKEEKRFEITKERIKELYQPADLINSSFHKNYGEHGFQDLSDEEKNRFMETLENNIIYGDEKLYKLFYELKEFNEQAADFPEYELEANNRYIEIAILIHKDLAFLRENIYLPKINSN